MSELIENHPIYQLLNVKPEAELSLQAAHEMVDALEKSICDKGGEMAKDGEVSISYHHHEFFPGIYKRRLWMPEGILGTSEIHKYEHPFFIMKGIVDVWDVETQKLQRIVGPYEGRTMPGTRRVLYAWTDVVWITIHHNPDDGQELSNIISRITVPKDNLWEELERFKGKE